jgi:hypothetical protein
MEAGESAVELRSDIFPAMKQGNGPHLVTPMESAYNHAGTRQVDRTLYAIEKPVVVGP